MDCNDSDPQCLLMYTVWCSYACKYYIHNKTTCIWVTGGHKSTAPLALHCCCWHVIFFFTLPLWYKGIYKNAFKSWRNNSYISIHRECIPVKQRAKSMFSAWRCARLRWVSLPSDLSQVALNCCYGSELNCIDDTTPSCAMAHAKNRPQSQVGGRSPVLSPRPALLTNSTQVVNITPNK